MKGLRNYLNKIKPNFEKGGRLHALHSFFDGMETFMFVPHTTSRTGTNIHDAIDSKRIMILVVIALLPALLFGMYNVGYQHFTHVAAFTQTPMTAGFWEMFFYGLLAVLPKIIVSYVVGLGIEFAVAQWKGEEIHEGILVTDSDDCPRGLSALDVGDCNSLLCNFCQGSLWWYRYERVQCGAGNPCFPFLCLSDQDVG